MNKISLLFALSVFFMVWIFASRNRFSLFSHQVRYSGCWIRMLDLRKR